MKIFDFFKTGNNRASGERKRELLAQVLSYVERHNLSTIPSILAKILELGRNPNASAQDYAKIYEMDQSSCMRLLALANSVYYGPRTGEVIRTVRDAIIRVGIRRSREVINSAVVATLFKSGAASADYSASDLWLNSVAVAVGSRIVLSLVPGAGGFSIDPYLAGLLHNVGVTVEHQVFYQDGFQQAVTARAANQSLLVEEEEKNIGLTHTQIGDMLAEHWEFPAGLRAVIAHHHDCAAKDPACLRMVHAVRAAQLAAMELGLGYSDFPQALATEYLDSCQQIGLDSATFVQLKERMGVEVERLKELGWFSTLKLKR